MSNDQQNDMPHGATAAPDDARTSAARLLGTLGGQSRSERKAAASRRNGRRRKRDFSRREARRAAREALAAKLPVDNATGAP